MTVKELFHGKIKDLFVSFKLHYVIMVDDFSTFLVTLLVGNSKEISAIMIDVYEALIHYVEAGNYY